MNVIKKHKELDIYFRDTDYIDVKTIEGETDLRGFISGMLSYYPWWLVTLYRIREIIVGVLGLVRHEKPETLPAIAPEDLSFAPHLKMAIDKELAIDNHQAPWNPTGHRSSEDGNSPLLEN